MIAIHGGLARLGRLEGHSGPVSAVAYCEGESSILSCSYDHSSILWDVETSKQVVTFSGHTGAIRDCMFAPGGRVCITAGDTSVRLWDRISGKQIGILRGHQSHVTCVDCARKMVGGVDDGMVILSGSYDCSALVWDIRVGIPIRTLIAHTAPVTSCCFSRDCTTAITAGRSKHLRMLKCAGDAIRRCRLSPDGSWLATAAQDGLMGLTKIGPDMTTQVKLSGAVEEGNPAAAAGAGAAEEDEEAVDCCWHPDGRLVAAVAGRVMHVFAFQHATAPAPGATGGGDRAQAVCVARCVGGGTVSERWGDDADRLAACCLLPLPAPAAAAPPDSGSLAAAGSHDGGVALWRLPPH